MGALLSIPLLTGGIASMGSAIFSGCMICMGGSAASAMCKSCNCNSSIATRIGFGLIFALSSMLAYLSKTDLAIKQLEKLSWDWIKMDCTGGKCYGLLAVHRFCFALALFHLTLSALLVGVQSTKTKRAAIQNGWWGIKIIFYFLLAFLTFLIPNEFFMAYGSYVAPIGACLFILIGLVLLIDFAHTWSETCLENWEQSNSNLWQFILVGSTFGLFIAAIALTIVLYVFFAGGGCGLNTFFITANLVLAVIVTVLAVSPQVQEANPKSGLTQASLVAAYCTYLTASAVVNHSGGESHCNPLHASGGTKTTTVVAGALFTFLAIAYSTTRAATQSKALVGKGRRPGAGAISLPTEGSDEDGEVRLVTNQPKGRRDEMRYQAILAAVNAGSLPASVLDEQDDEDDEIEATIGEERDDERGGTKYNYSWFHIIFVMAAMYVAGLLTDWAIISTSPVAHPADPSEPLGLLAFLADEPDVYIGRSESTMWMRTVSSWLCYALYSWSLIGPVVMPDRFGDA
ncbi:serine incorporator/TMS membrane protein [Dioszegia hungarica]|uniref:Serine incorporator/TMS membrane protein n=1 Tax=Dioszegia hungarica TaxID=4972 RepID=A0AA38HEA3_9TREE|nr:serine incorporator/TMS membrane protein [Dioszegia hungarica]KAI9638995.1 serine incorporator/TMS membrane protein [Dioszegia hungarica]